MSPAAHKFFVISLIYLVLGLLAQAIAVFDTWLGFNPLAYTTSVTIEQILLIGWLTQLGIALVYDRWPEPSSTPRIVVLILFNLGLPLTIIGQPGVIMFGGRWLGPIAAFGGLLQFFAGLVFVYDIWKTFQKP